MTRILTRALIVAAMFAPALAAGAELGRLFFTPQQREDFDRRRASNVKEEPAAPPVVSVTVRGRVTRSSGKTTTWINDVPQNDSFGGPDASRVTLPAGEGESSVTLKVGETLDTASGKTRDALGDSDIKVRRGAQGPR